MQRARPSTRFLRRLRLTTALLCTLACMACAWTGSFRNPVLDTNFPDPFVLRTPGGFFAYATNGNGRRIQSAVSFDLVHWQMAGDAMPGRPAWADDGFTWAPEVMQVGSRYLMFYTARLQHSGIQCIGVAIGQAPQGPFDDPSASPLFCQPDEGGSIDPSPFRAPDGKLYLYWKNDGNARAMGLPGRPPVGTWLHGQELAADGLSLSGTAHRLLRNDAPWEGDRIEAPTVLYTQGLYYLLYSANDYATAGYAVGYATATSPLGPFVKAARNPILGTGGDSAGPGHQSVVVDDAGRHWIVFHAWHAGAIGDGVGARVMRIEPLRFDADGSLARVVPQDWQEPAPEVSRH